MTDLQKAEEYGNRFLDQLYKQLHNEKGTLFNCVESCFLGTPVITTEVDSPSGAYDEDAAEDGCVGGMLSCVFLTQHEVPPRLNILQSKLNKVYQSHLNFRIPDVIKEIDLKQWDVEVELLNNKMGHTDLEIIFHLWWK